VRIGQLLALAERILKARTVCRSTPEPEIRAWRAKMVTDARRSRSLCRGEDFLKLDDLVRFPPSRCPDLQT